MLNACPYILGLQTKADKYIVKPFDMEVLKANIANVLANREIMKKRFSQFKFNADEVGIVTGKQIGRAHV